MNDMNTIHMRTFLIAALMLVAGARPSYAQSAQVPGWLNRLDSIETSKDAVEKRLAQLDAVTRELGEWIALNPRFSWIQLPSSDDHAKSDDGRISTQLKALRETINQIAASDPSHPFYLGVTTVNVTASAAPLSPVSDSLDQVEIRNHDALTVNRAIEYLPGVSVDHKSPRNQTGISIGGFDSRQVPLYVDGVPAYDPFDGFVDLTRYLTTDIAEVQVAKGYSSALLGPNLLGGVINLVTKQPQKNFEGDALIGTGPGGLLNSGLHAGSKWSRFFFQGSADRLQSDFYPISGSFALNAQQTADQRVNSNQRDERYMVRAGWTPREHDSYVLSYSNQTGVTGIPPYSGTAPMCPTGNTTLTTPCVTPKYWQWPHWDTDSLYFNSKTALGLASSIQFRAFYQRFANTMAMFDDATYSTQNLNASSGTLVNHDHSAGVSGHIETRRVPRNAIGASFFIKDDTHGEQTTTFAKANNLASTTPLQTDRDRQSSFGIQDVVTVSSRISATVGLSADHLDGLQAQDLSADKTQVVAFQVSGICAADSTASFSSCTDHVWAYHPAATISYSDEKAGALFVAYAEKSRFPTLKDRYSYKAGKAVPNPTLNPERARTWSAGYSRAFPLRTVAQVEVYRSDVRDEIANISFLSVLCPSGGRGGAGSCQQAVNVGAELHEGVNLTLRTTPAPRLTLDANYSYLHRNITGTTGAFPVGTPTHKTIGTATVRLPRGATAMLSGRFESGAVGMSDNNLPLPAAAFATFDAGGTLPIRVGISVQAGIRNLLDRNYFYWEGFPEEGRTGYVTLRYGF
jgi:iron complex outermembrane receptor protein